MFKHINLQLFAEETIPEKAEESKPVEAKEPSPIWKAFGLKPKEPEKKPEAVKEADKIPDNKPDEKAAEKPIDTVKELDKTNDKQPDKEEEFIPVKHLGKEVKVPVTERDKYIQKGLDYDFVKGESEKTKAALQRVAKLEGFDKVDDYLAELDKRDNAKLAEKIEEAAGDPDKINDIIENHPKVIKVMEKDRINSYKEAKAELSKDQFFKELEPELDRLAELNPTQPPELIYKIIRSDFLTPDKIKEFVTKEKESAVKTTIADIHDKERRATPTGGDTTEGKDVVVPSAFTSKLAGIFGVSATKIAQRSHEKMKRS